MRPLVFLDVDGVINDLGSHDGVGRPWSSRRIRSHGYELIIPEYLPGLIQGLCRMASVVWCTTWREWANEEIAVELGVGPLPVLDPGGIDRSRVWKAPAVAEFLHSVPAARSVYWIEDFLGQFPDHLPRVTFVDTMPHPDHGVLMPEHLPDSISPTLEGSSHV